MTDPVRIKARIPDRIKVLLADDHRMVREALRAVLEPECEIVAEAATGEEAVALAMRTKPSVVVMDIAMAGTGGLAAAHHIARQAPASRVLMLSQSRETKLLSRRNGQTSPIKGPFLRSGLF